jgi:hypothetical protein
MSRVPFLVLAAAFGLAACDSAAPINPTPGTPSTPNAPSAPGTPSTPGEAASIVYTGPEAESVGIEDGEDLVFALSALFRANAAAGPLEYTASPASGSITARIDGDSLRVTLSATTSGFVTVTATGSGGIRARGDVPVRALGRCPAGVPAGQVSLFPEPLDVGTVWTYAVTTSESRPASVSFRSAGTVRLLVTASECSDGVQRLSMVETRDLRRERAGPTGEWVFVSQDTSTSTYFWNVTATDVTTTAPQLEGRPGGQLDAPPFGRPVRRFVGLSAVSGGTYQNPVPTPFGPYVTFRAGVGPSRYDTQTFFGTAGTGNVSWTFTGG